MKPMEVRVVDQNALYLHTMEMRLKPDDSERKMNIVESESDPSFHSSLFLQQLVVLIPVHTANTGRKVSFEGINNVTVPLRFFLLLRRKTMGKASMPAINAPGEHLLAILTKNY